MLWPSRRFVVTALALGTAPFMTRAMAEERPRMAGHEAARGDEVVR